MRKRFKILPSPRPLLFLCVLVLIPFAAWLLWNPGADLRDGRHDRGTNGLWLQHGWLGADDWFTRNAKSPAPFRDPQKIADLAALAHAQHIQFLYPHLCPAQRDGTIAASDSAQVERFLDACQGLAVLPWVGGVRGDSATPADPAWRASFTASCAQLLQQHPRLAGIHLNIEPLPSGDPDFLTLLEQLRRALPPGKLLSVAAYPPPTRWQPVPGVHWDETYSRAVAARVDQAVIMMYDTSLHTGKLYEQLMKDWTRETLLWYAPTQILLGLPSYDDVADYHDPSTENLPHALAGLHAGLGTTPPSHYAGVSLYSEWQMNPAKWQAFDDRFLARPPVAASASSPK